MKLKVKLLKQIQESAQRIRNLKEEKQTLENSVSAAIKINYHVFVAVCHRIIEIERNIKKEGECLQALLLNYRSVKDIPNRDERRHDLYEGMGVTACFYNGLDI
jgi:hypothetical protein